MKKLTSSKSKGVTLIELLIAIAILGILTSIIVPSYNGQITKSRRADAQIALATAVNILERCYVNHNSYKHASCKNFPKTGSGVFVSDDGHYKVYASLITDEQFTLIATANTTSPQKSDTDCKTFSMKHDGSKTATNNYCWS